MENEENILENASEKDISEPTSKDNSDDDVESSFQVVDSWEDRDSDTEMPGEKRAAVQKATSVDNEEDVPAKRPKLVDVDEDSDDDFAAQLLEGQDSNSL